jgi:hypothetical protein
MIVPLMAVSPPPVWDRVARTVTAIRPNSPSGRISASATTRWRWSKPVIASDAGSSDRLIS